MQRLLHPIGIVLSNPGLRRLQIAWAGSMFGSCAYIVALSVIAFRAGGATTLGLVMLARTAAAAVASPLLGGLADQYSRRWLMAASDGARAALTLGMALIVGSGAESRSHVPDVYAFAIAIAVVGAVFRPAQAALSPELAASPEELTASNALAGTIESVGIFLGPGIGGLVMAITGPHVVFAMCCAAYAVSAAFVLSITEPAREPVEREAGTDGDSFSVMSSAPALVAVTLTYAAQAFATGALSVFAVVMAIGELGLGAPGVGYLDSAFGVGGVLGGVLATAMSGTRRLAVAFSAGVAAWGIGVALMGVTASTLIVLVLMAGVGVGNTVVDVTAVTLIQRSAPDQVLGRVFGVIESVLMASLGAGAAIAPLFEHRLGLRTSLVVTGLALPVVVVLTQRWLIRLDGVDDQVARRVALLRAHRIFAPLADATLEQLARQLTDLEVAAENWVIRQGEVGDQVYVVESGRLTVDVDGQAGDELAAGDVFGEIALLRDIPRTASVRALTECRLLALGRDEFLAAITGHPRSAAEAAVVVSARLAALRPGLVTT